MLNSFIQLLVLMRQNLFDDRQKLHLLAVYFLACLWFVGLYTAESMLKGEFTWINFFGVITFSLVMGGIFWGALLWASLQFLNQWSDSIWLRYGLFLGGYLCYMFSHVYPEMRDWDSFVAAYYRFYKKREGLNYFLLNPLMLAFFSAFWLELAYKVYCFFEKNTLPTETEILDDNH
jgi:hypothetical protein